MGLIYLFNSHKVLFTVFVVFFNVEYLYCFSMFLETAWVIPAILFAKYWAVEEQYFFEFFLYKVIKYIHFISFNLKSDFFGMGLGYQAENKISQFSR